MDLTRMSDLAVLLALFYVGWRGWATACDASFSRPAQVNGAMAGLLLWALAALHAICHLGGR